MWQILLIRRKHSFTNGFYIRYTPHLKNLPTGQSPDINIMVIFCYSCQNFTNCNVSCVWYCQYKFFISLPRVTSSHRTTPKAQLPKKKNYNEFLFTIGDHNKNKLVTSKIHWGDKLCYLHIALSCEGLIKNGLNGHPLEREFPVTFCVIDFLFVHVTSQSKVGHLCNFVVTNKNVAGRQIAVNKTFSGKIFLKTQF